jgi:glycosyltransferase involved in cell wall biosynthesis
MLGKPIIACNVGGNPEIIHDRKTGLLVPPEDSQALLLAMRKLHEEPKLARTLGKNARTLYENNFQFDRIVTDKILPLYEAHDV